MNIFKIIMLDSILLLFPRIVYLTYLSTNKNIINKELYSSLSLITSFFLIYIFNENIYIAILIINSIITLAYLEDKYILANIICVSTVTLYMQELNYLWVLLLIYLIAIFLHIIQNQKKISKVLFIEIYVAVSSALYLQFIYYNEINFDFNIIIGYIIITNIVCAMNYIGKDILKTHMSYKEMQKEKQIRTSLFKITHEIKNPIAVCKGYLDMLDVDNTNQVKKYIPIIKSEIERLLGILQDYLLINKASMDLDIMDFNVLIEETIEKLNPLIKSKNINLCTNLEEDEIFINGDYNRLSQVMINIIKNSIEAIECNCGKIEIEAKLNNSNCCIKIEDNGCGMTTDTMKKMKTPFYTTKLRGSGLGVSLIYEIVEAHGGKVEYLSQYGKGTKVMLYFPIKTIEN